MIKFISEGVYECYNWFRKVNKNNFIDEKTLRYDINNPEI